MGGRRRSAAARAMAAGAALALGGCFLDIEAEGPDFPLEPSDFYGEWKASRSQSLSVSENFLHRGHANVTGGVDIYAAISGWEPARPSEKDIPQKEDRLEYAKGFVLSGVHGAGSVYDPGTPVSIRLFINSAKTGVYYAAVGGVGGGVFEAQRPK